jgi:large subunit ribosomal protein L29
MKRKELMDVDKSEYATKLSELRKELIKLSAQASTGTAMKNPGLIRQAKRNIARLLTLQKRVEAAKKE